MNDHSRASTNGNLNDCELSFLDRTRHAALSGLAGVGLTVSRMLFTPLAALACGVAFGLQIAHERGLVPEDAVGLMQIWAEPVISGLLLALLILAVRNNPSPIVLPAADGRAVAQVTTGRALTDVERWRVAVHEAGHLLACRLYKSDIGNVTARVQIIEGVNRGFVRAAAGKFPDQTEDDLCSFCRLSLAGEVSEQLVFGFSGTGNEVDRRQWERAARNFLTCYGRTDHPWFAEPQNAAEAAVNASTLDILRETDTAAVTKFLAGNEALIREVAHALLAHNELDAEQCRAFVDQMPRVSPREIDEAACGDANCI